MAEILANGERHHVQRLLPDDPTGQVVVFVHGLIMDNLSSFYCTLANPLLKAGAELVLYDLRGHGLSSRPPAGYSLDDLSNDLVGILDALEIYQPVHLVANSFGGLVAIRTALRRPDRVATLSLLEGLYGDGWIELATNSLTMAALNMSIDRIAQNMASIGQRKLSRLAAHAEGLLNQTSLIDDLAQTPPEAADLWELECPTLAIYGEHSDLLPGVQEAAAVRPNIRLVVSPGMGHMILHDATHSLLTLLLEWLQLRVLEPSAR